MKKYKGETIKQAEERLKLSYGTIKVRLYRGWSEEDAFTNSAFPRQYLKERNILKHRGETVFEASKRLGIKPDTIRRRIKEGVHIDKAFSLRSKESINSRSRIFYEGESIEQAEKRLGVKKGTVKLRLYRGWDFKKAFNTYQHRNISE